MFSAIFRARANPAHLETLKHSVALLAQESQDQPGTLRYEFYQEAEDPTQFLLFAIWESEADWKNHVASDAHERHVASLPEGAWADPPAMTRLQPLENES